MRKNSLFLLGAAAGVGLTLLVTGPQGSQLVAAATAATGPDTYSQLNLFGEVFERIRTNYVERPDDAKLIEASINGMITAPTRGT
jgi:carboxyl-terminal processing protease